VIERYLRAENLGENARKKRKEGEGEGKGRERRGKVKELGKV